MGGYDWAKIASNKTDKELLLIYKERNREPLDKVNAAIAELKRRDILADEVKPINLEPEYKIYDLNEVKETRPNLHRAKWAKNLVLAVLVIELVALISSYLQYDFLNDALEGVYLDFEAAERNDLRELIVAISHTIVFTISAVTFIMWFRRAYYNLHLRVSICEQSEGWAAGAWFVPIISLFRPYKIMKELFVKTAGVFKARTSGLITKLDKGSVVTWWTLWILTGYIGNFILKYSFKADSIEDFIFSTLADMGLIILNIPLAIITISIINRYSKNEEVLYAQEMKAKALSKEEEF